MTFSASGRGWAGKAKPQPSPDGKHQPHRHYRRPANGATARSESEHIGRYASEIVVADDADNVPHLTTGHLLSLLVCLFGDREPGAVSQSLCLHCAISHAADHYPVVTQQNRHQFARNPETVTGACSPLRARHAIQEGLLEHKGFVAQHGLASTSTPLELGGSRG